MFRQTRFTMALSLLILAAVVLGAASSASAAPRVDRHGFFLGLDLGAGGGGLEYEKGGQTYESDDDQGCILGLRAGYAFNPYFSLSFDHREFHHEGDDFEYKLNTGTITATVYPMGGGFFMRFGVGAGCLETEVPGDSDDPLIEEFEEEGGVLGFGLGYDWMVNEHFAIGLSLDARGLALEDFGEFEDLRAGEGSLGVTMNYYF